MIINQDRGSFSSITEKRVSLINSISELKDIWSDHCHTLLPPLPMPDVDFEKQSMIIFFAGSKSSLAHRADVIPLVIKGADIVVKTRVTHPASDAVAGAAMTSPWHYIIVNKVRGILKVMNRV